MSTDNSYTLRNTRNLTCTIVKFDVATPLDEPVRDDSLVATQSLKHYISTWRNTLHLIWITVPTWLLFGADQCEFTSRPANPDFISFSSASPYVLTVPFLLP